MPDYIRVEGLRELQKAVRQAAGPGAQRALRNAGRISVSVVVTEAKSEVPVRSGRLQSSIGGGATNNTAFVKAGTESRVPYAGPINYGWPLASMKRALSKSSSPYWRWVSRVMKRGISGSHFLDGAVAKTYPLIAETYEREIENALSDINMR